MNTSSSDKITARHTSLTGWQIRKSLDALGVSVNRFARHTGRNETTVRRWLSGAEDGTIPLWVELVLMLYHLMPELRSRDGRVALPLDEWGARGSGPRPPED